MKIISTKYFLHDNSACFIDTKKKNIFAMSLERISRIKHDGNNISPLLHEYASQFTKEVDVLAFPHTKLNTPYHATLSRIISLHRQITNPKYVKDLKPGTVKQFKNTLKTLVTNPLVILKYLGFKLVFVLLRIVNKLLGENTVSKLIPFWTLERFAIKDFAKYNINFKKISRYDHHLAHAASAYYATGNDQEALVITMDGEGDGFFSKVFIFNTKEVRLLSESPAPMITINNRNFPFSIGAVYTNFTEALELQRNSDEGKVEALAAYGKKDDHLYAILDSCFKITEEGILMGDRKNIQKVYDITFLKKERARLGDKNFATTIQSWLEHIMVEYVNFWAQKFPDIKYLYLAGGVVANVIANLKIYENTRFKEIFIAPPMGDDGLALGAALLAAKDAGEDISWVKKYQNQMPYFGNEITEQELMEALKKFKGTIRWEKIDYWQEDAAENIANKKVIAVVQGRMEFGPRALGNRSILASPVYKEVRDRINAEIKRRPWYQPFCPSVLEEERERLFQDSFHHKHMAIAFRIKDEYRNRIPSAMHVDGTARPQFVTKKDNPNYYKLLQAVKERTGFGVVINTSFNLHGRTIVRTAEDAITDFTDCNLDVLYINGIKITRL